jgi:alpha-tubulin suppressor-like RCC1 family protein
MHSMALCESELVVDGKIIKKQNLFTWGAGNYGQLGNGSTGDAHTPTEVIIPFSKDSIVQLAAGNQHTVFLTSKGYVYSFGYNAFGQLGLGNSENSFKP